MATATTSRRLSQSAPVAAPAKRLTLADTIKGAKQLPSRVVFHGHGGIGKTSWAAHAPSPFFILSPGETGIHTLIDSGIIEPIDNIELPVQNGWGSMLDLLQELSTADHNYKTLVVDVIDGVEKLANQHVAVTDYGGDLSERGFMGFQRGYKAVAQGPWRQLLQELDRLRDLKRMGIILLAHTGLGNFQNPLGPDFNRYVPDLYKDSWGLTYGWADIVLFGHREIAVSKDKGDRKAKGMGGDQRVMLTEWSAAADAKNRHNLPPEIDMGNSGKEAWENFTRAIKESRTPKEQ